MKKTIFIFLYLCSTKVKGETQGGTASNVKGVAHLGTIKPAQDPGRFGVTCALWFDSLCPPGFANTAAPRKYTCNWKGCTKYDCCRRTCEGFDTSRCAANQRLAEFPNLIKCPLKNFPKEDDKGCNCRDDPVVGKCGALDGDCRQCEPEDCCATTCANFEKTKCTELNLEIVEDKDNVLCNPGDNNCTVSRCCRTPRHRTPIVRPICMPYDGTQVPDLRNEQRGSGQPGEDKMRQILDCMHWWATVSGGTPLVFRLAQDDDSRERFDECQTLQTKVRRDHPRFKLDELIAVYSNRRNTKTDSGQRFQYMENCRDACSPRPSYTDKTIRDGPFRDGTNRIPTPMTWKPDDFYQNRDTPEEHNYPGDLYVGDRSELRKITKADFRNKGTTCQESCTFVITESYKTYRLEEDVLFSKPNNFWSLNKISGTAIGIAVDASNVIIDLNGHKIGLDDHYSQFSRFFTTIRLNKSHFFDGEGVWHDRQGGLWGNNGPNNEACNNDDGKCICDNRNVTNPLGSCCSAEGRAEELERKVDCFRFQGHSNITIRNGIVGRNSHFGVSGFRMVSITLEDLTIENSEVSAIHFVGSRNLVMRNIVIDNSNLIVKADVWVGIVWIISSSLIEYERLNYLGRRAIDLARSRNILGDELQNFNDDKEVMEVLNAAGEDDDGISVNEQRAAQGNIYGIILKSGDNPDIGNIKPLSYVTIENVHIKNWDAGDIELVGIRWVTKQSFFGNENHEVPDEVLATRDPDASSIADRSNERFIWADMFNEKGFKHSINSLAEDRILRIRNKMIRVKLQLLRFTNRDSKALAETAEDDSGSIFNEGFYDGLRDDSSPSIGQARQNRNVWNWLLDTEITGDARRQNAFGGFQKHSAIDCRGHKLRGIAGIFLYNIQNYRVQDVRIENIGNAGKWGCEDDPQFKWHADEPALRGSPKKLVFQAGNAYGILLQDSSNGLIKNVTIDNIRSVIGIPFGVASLGWYTKNLRYENVHVTNVRAFTRDRMSHPPNLIARGFPFFMPDHQVGNLTRQVLFIDCTPEVIHMSTWKDCDDKTGTVVPWFGDYVCEGRSNGPEDPELMFEDFPTDCRETRICSGQDACSSATDDCLMSNKSGGAEAGTCEPKCEVYESEWECRRKNCVWDLLRCRNPCVDYKSKVACTANNNKCRWAGSCVDANSCETFLEDCSKYTTPINRPITTVCTTEKCSKEECCTNRPITHAKPECMDVADTNKALLNVPVLDIEIASKAAELRIVKLRQFNWDKLKKDKVYRIKKPGHYQLQQDIFIDWKDFREPEYVDEEQLTKDPHHFGVIAAIAIEADNVILDLKGFTIGMSEEYRARQRFFTVILLNNQPHPYGTAGFHRIPQIHTPRKVKIMNGIIGPSSHFGILGRGNKGVEISDVLIENFEVGGIRLIDCEDVKIANVNLSNKGLIVPVNQFSGIIFQTFKNMKRMSQEEIDPEKNPPNQKPYSPEVQAMIAMSKFGVMLWSPRKVMATAVNTRPIGKNLEELEFWRDLYLTSDPEVGHPKHLAHGQVTHPVTGVYLASSTVLTNDPSPAVSKVRNVRIEQVGIRHLHRTYGEHIGIRLGRRILKDVQGNMLLWDCLWDDDGNRWNQTRLDEDSAVAARWKVLSFQVRFANWVEPKFFPNHFISYILDVSDDTNAFDLVIGGETIQKVGSRIVSHDYQQDGIFALRARGVDKLSITQLDVLNVTNTDHIASEMHAGEPLYSVDPLIYGGPVHSPKIYKGSYSYGMAFESCSNVAVDTSTVEKVWSKNGHAFGIAIYGRTIDPTLTDTSYHFSEVSLSKIAVELHQESGKIPNVVPKAMPWFIQENIVPYYFDVRPDTQYTFPLTNCLESPNGRLCPPQPVSGSLAEYSHIPVEACTLLKVCIPANNANCPSRCFQNASDNCVVPCAEFTHIDKCIAQKCRWLKGFNCVHTCEDIVDENVCTSTNCQYDIVTAKCLVSTTCEGFKSEKCTEFGDYVLRYDHESVTCKNPTTCFPHECCMRTPETHATPMCVSPKVVWNPNVKKVFDISKHKRCDSEDVVEITSNHFSNKEDGRRDMTYRITEPGCYKLAHNLKFDFGESPHLMEDPYHHGFTIGISIESNDVILDLNWNMMEMGTSFYGMQRFFNMIQLNNQIFEPGNAGFTRNRLKKVMNVIIRNGTCRFTSHFCIHGIKAKNVVIENFRAEWFEVGGIQCNDCSNIVMRNITIDNRSIHAPINAFSSVIFQVWRTVKMQKRIARPPVYHGESVELIDAPWFNDVFFNPGKDKQEDITVNKKGLIVGSSFGIQLKKTSNVDPIAPPKGFHLKDIKVMGVQCGPGEIVGIRIGSKKLFDDKDNALNWYHLWKANGDRIPDPEAGDDLHAKINYRIFMMQIRVTNMVFPGRIPFSFVKYVIDPRDRTNAFDLRIDGEQISKGTGFDTRNHPSVGLFGIRLQGVSDVILDNVLVEDIHNDMPLTSTEEAGQPIHVARPILWRGFGESTKIMKYTIAYGIAVEEVTNAWLSRIRIHNVYSASGNSMGLALYGGAKDLNIWDIDISDIRTTNVAKIYTLPHIRPLPRGMEVFVQEDVFNVDTLHFTDVSPEGWYIGPETDCVTGGFAASKFCPADGKWNLPYPSDCRRARECAVKLDADECGYTACRWLESGKTKCIAGCDVYETEKKCLGENCRWLASNECAQDCVEIKDRKNCEDVLCQWISSQRKCKKAETCDSIPESKCRESKGRIRIYDAHLQACRGACTEEVCCQSAVSIQVTPVCVDVPTLAPKQVITETVEPFDDDNKDQTTRLNRFNFTDGTLHITESGSYSLAENIVIDFPDRLSENPPFSAARDDIQETEFSDGWVVGISIEANSVSLDLKNFTISTTNEFRSYNPFFTMIHINDQPHASFEGHTVEVEKESKRKIVIKNGSLRGATHFLIRGVYSSQIVLKNLALFDFNVAAIHFTDVSQLHIENVSIDNVGRKGTHAATDMSYVYGQLYRMLGKIQTLYDNGNGPPEIRHLPNIQTLSEVHGSTEILEVVQAPGVDPHGVTADDEGKTYPGPMYGIVIKKTDHPRGAFSGGDDYDLNSAIRGKANAVKIKDVSIKNVITAPREHIGIRVGSKVLCDFRGNRLLWGDFFGEDGAKFSSLAMESDPALRMRQKMFKLQVRVTNIVAPGMLQIEFVEYVNDDRDTMRAFNVRIGNNSLKKSTGMHIRHGASMEGAYGLKLYGVENAWLEGITIDGIHNLGRTSSTLEGGRALHNPHPIVWRGREHSERVYKGSFAYGLSIDACYGVTVDRLQVNNIRSLAGIAFGVAILRYTTDINLGPTGSVTAVTGGRERRYSASSSSSSEDEDEDEDHIYASFPNIQPKGVRLFREESSEDVTFFGDFVPEPLHIAPGVDCVETPTMSEYCSPDPRQEDWSFRSFSFGCKAKKECERHGVPEKCKGECRWDNVLAECSPSCGMNTFRETCVHRDCRWKDEMCSPACHVLTNNSGQTKSSEESSAIEAECSLKGCRWNPPRGCVSSCADHSDDGEWGCQEAGCMWNTGFCVNYHSCLAFPESQCFEHDHQIRHLHPEHHRCAKKECTVLECCIMPSVPHVMQTCNIEQVMERPSLRSAYVARPSGGGSGERRHMGEGADLLSMNVINRKLIVEGSWKVESVQGQGKALRITSSGVYTLYEDITLNWRDHQLYGYGDPLHNGDVMGISIEADDVILDLGGKTIGMHADMLTRQPFFNVIQLSNQPFRQYTNGYNLYNLTSAQNVIIRNGKIGPTSHYCIHGLENKHITLENIKCVDFHVGGFQFNDGENIKIANCVLDNSNVLTRSNTFYHTLMPIYRLAKYAYFWRIGLPMESDVGGSNDGEEKWEVEERTRDILESSPFELDPTGEAWVFDDIIKNPTLDHFKLTLSKDLLPLGAQYGIHIQQTPARETKVHNIFIENTKIYNINSGRSEIIGIKIGSKQLYDGSNVAIQWAQIFDEAGERWTKQRLQGEQMTAQRMAYKMLRAQLSTYLLVRGHDPVLFAFLEYIKLELDTRPASELQILGLPVARVTGRSIVEHTVPRGAFGIRLYGVSHARVLSVMVTGVHNHDELGSTIEAGENIHFPAAPYVWRGGVNGRKIYKGTFSYGVSMEKCQEIDVLALEVSKVTSDRGPAFGVAVFDSSRGITFYNPHIETPEIPHTTKLHTLPNILPIGIGLFQQEHALKEVSIYAPSEKNTYFIGPNIDCFQNNEASEFCPKEGDWLSLATQSVPFCQNGTTSSMKGIETEILEAGEKYWWVAAGVAAFCCICCLWCCKYQKDSAEARKRDKYNKERLKAAGSKGAQKGERPSGTTTTRPSGTTTTRPSGTTTTTKSGGHQMPRKSTE